MCDRHFVLISSKSNKIYVGKINSLEIDFSQVLKIIIIFKNHTKRYQCNEIFVLKAGS